MPYTVEQFVDNLTSAFAGDFEENYVDATTTPQPTNISKVFQALVDSWWDGNQENIDTLLANAYLPTMSGENLEKYASVVSLERRAGESDAAYRIRISGAIRQEFAGTDANSIIEFVASAIGADPSDITYTENCVEEGDPYCPAQYFIQFDVGLLGALGFAPSEYQAAVDLMNEVLTDMSAAGVLGEVVFTGGAEYDTDDYDTAGDIFGA